MKQILSVGSLIFGFLSVAVVLAKDSRNGKSISIFTMKNGVFTQNKVFFSLAI